ncbi:hypothetical protein RI367_004085 [Sorochytrium milnesiophthora]
MPTSQERNVATLPRLPPELVEEVLVHAGVDACAALRHLPALRRVLADYVRAGNYTNDCEKAMLKILVDCRWSDGVQAMIDAGIRHPFCRVVGLDWSGIVLPVSSIRKLHLWCLAANHLDTTGELLAVLVYNRINTGAECTDLLQWGVRQVPDFVRELSRQYILHDHSLDQLRAFHQAMGVYLYERDIAKTLMPLAARHGRLELVQTLDGIIPEVLQEHSDVIRLAAKNGHLQVVQYAHSRLLFALPQYILEAAMEQGHECVARWLYERHPQAVGWRAALALAQSGHIDLLQQLQANKHIRQVESDEWEQAEWWSSAGALAATAPDARVVQLLLQFNPAFSIIDAVARDASCAYLPTLQHIIRNESPPPSLRVFCAAASAGRTDIVDWMLVECPLWTSAEAIKCAAGAGHQELAQKLSDHFGVPLKECQLQPPHLQGLVASGHLQKLEWIEGHCELSCIDSIVYVGIRSRNLAVAQLLHRHCQDVEFTAEMLTEACRSGNLRMVQWVYRHLPASVKPADAIDTAAELGFEQIVAWLHHSTDLPCTASAMTDAACIGRLDIVRFLHEHRKEGCTNGAMTYAISKGHLDVADYLRLHRKERCTTLWGSGSGSTLASIQWIAKHYPDLLTESILFSAARCSRVDIIQYCHTLSNAPFSAATMDTAAAVGDLDLVRWFHGHRTEGCTVEAMKEAAMVGYLSVVKFLHEHGYSMCEWDDIKDSPEYIKEWWRSIQAKDHTYTNEYPMQ